MGVLIVGAEVAAAQDVGGSHQGRRNGVEEEGGAGQQARQRSTESTKQRQETGEKRADGEEEANEEKGKHEAAHVIVFLRSDELRRYSLGGAKVPRRIKGIRWANGIARVAAIDRVARIPQRPSSRTGRARDVVGGGAQEVDVVQRRPIPGAGQHNEEDQ